jgi:hypothetical protein
MRARVAPGSSEYRSRAYSVGLEEALHELGVTLRNTERERTLSAVTCKLF